MRPLNDTSIPTQRNTSGMSAEQVLQANELEQSLPPVRNPLTEADRGQWRLVRQVVDHTTLLTLKADEAVYYGLATQVVNGEDQVRAYFGSPQVRRFDASWSEGLVRILCSLPVRAILIIVFLICLFVELAAPGMGVFGATALVALLILIGAPALAGMAQWWDILLIVVGLALVAAEIFVLPGMGICGVAGVVCLVAGMIGTFVSDDLGTATGRAELWAGLITTLSSMFAAGVGMWLISRHLQSIPVLNRLVLRTEVPSPVTAAATAAVPRSLLQAMAPARPGLKVGDIGRAETDLRPAGKAVINGRLCDVTSVVGYLAKGTAIRVVSDSSLAIEVEEVEP